MIIYKDALGSAQDELLTDVMKVEEIHNGVILRVKGKMTTEKTEVSDAMFGGNASAEGADADAGAEDVGKSGINVVLNHRLMEYALKKKDYMVHIKEYIGKVKDRIKEECPDQMETFVAESQKFVKNLIGEFKDWAFYCGESMDPDGMLVMVKWEGEDPYLYYFKHGLEAEKV